MKTQLNARPLHRRIEQSDADDENDDELPQESTIFELIVPVDNADDQR
jgi:hypothetical protein